MLIAQLSDVHVRRRGELYRGLVDSNRMFAEAIEHLRGLDRRPDLVVLTGDLVDEGHADEYANACELLKALDLPCLVVPGNHDERVNFTTAFRNHAYLPANGPLHYCVDEFPVRIVALDSCPPGKHHGDVRADGLEWLRATLDSDLEKPTLVLMHHPPFTSGIPYLDDYRYFEGDRLASIIEGRKNIEAVLCGHVHRSMVRRWAGTVVMACPSTTTQIALRLAPRAEPCSYVGPSACLLHLWTEGGLVSHTSYIGEFEGPYPFF